MREKTEYKSHHKNTHISTIEIKENKQLNIQQKQNYPGSVASYDTRPGNEVASNSTNTLDTFERQL